MASGLKTLRVRITGDSTSAQKAISSLEKSGTQAQSGLSRINVGAAAVGAGMVTAAAGIVHFAETSVDSFKNVANGAAQIQKTMGGTTEEASRLRYVAQVTGVDLNDLTLGLRYMGKDAASGGKGLAKLGISAKDSNGHMKPMSVLLNEVRDKISKMQPSAERTADLISIFGKRGQALTPILTLTKDKFQDLSKESDQLGLTLDKNATTAVKNQAIEQRRLAASMDALKVNLGRALMPVIQGFTEMLVKNVIPAVKSVTGWMQTHKSTVHLLVAVLGPLLTASLAVGGAMKLFGPLFTVLRPLIMGVVTAMRALNLAFLTNPIVLIIVAIIALVAGFIYLWRNCESFRNFWKAAWRDIAQWAINAGHWIVSAWNAVVGWFAGLGHWFSSLFSSVWGGIIAGFKFVVNYIIGGINDITGALNSVATLGGLLGDHGPIPSIPGLAGGGTVTRGGATWVGERGPELLNLPSGSRVTPMGSGGGGTTVNVTVNVAGHVKAEKDLAVAISGHVRNELRRVGARNGGVVGLA